ncbi:MAG TPA: DNA primase [Acidimicrobiales bacterium]|nr:DNA primase [Acidimicrobiales bacterium]
MNLPVALTLVPEEDIARVRSAVSLVELVAEHTAVKAVGGRHMARCPFHPDRTPSLSVDDRLGLYYCFGCQAAGDAISFVEQVHHLGFRDALELLAERAGIELASEDDSTRQERRRLAALRRAVEQAVAWYHRQLLGPAGEPARDYLARRGVTGEEIERWRLGYAPARRSVVAGAGIDPKLARELGLATAGREPLAGRVVFPIDDAAGGLVGLAGRALDGGGPKYLNSPETPLYAKRQVLYGLGAARRAVVAADTVVVCEGYLDVIAMHRAGITNAVATCGVALTAEHMRVLSRFARRIVVAFDGDAAGQGAVRELHRHERAGRSAIAVAELPAGEDPASLVESGRAEELAAALASARPLLGWRINRLLAAADLTTPEGRVAAADAGMALIAGHHDPRVREQYARELAAACRLDPAPLAAKARRAADERRPAARRAGPAGVELDGLRLAVVRPDAVAEWMEPWLFADEGCRAAVAALLAAEDLADAVRAAGPAGPLIARAAGEPADADPDAVYADLVLRTAERNRWRIAAMASGASVAEADALGTWYATTMCRAADDADRDAIDELYHWLAGLEHDG